MKIWYLLLLIIPLSLHAEQQSGICFVKKQTEIENFYRTGECPRSKSTRISKGLDKGIEIQSDRIGVLFDFNDTRLKPAFFELLGEWGRALKNLKEMRFSIQGHTDNIGTEDYNQQLSWQRAQQVKRYLVANYGIDAQRLTVIGFGEQAPLRGTQTWQTDEDRYWNRRVEFVLKSQVEP